MESSIWLWAGFNLFVLALLASDLGILHRKEREIRVGEALWLSLFYIVLALLFGAGLLWLRGTQDGVDFLTHYLIEKSLSVDNIFVIVLIFTYFSVPAQYQHRVQIPRAYRDDDCQWRPIVDRSIAPILADTGTSAVSCARDRAGRP
jgi:tellurite resistance protein TerC